MIGGTVEEFIENVEHPRKKKDSIVLVEMMEEVTGDAPVMWGPTTVGFGSYHYRYESGREGDAPKIAFAPRKRSLTIYLPCVEEQGFNQFS